MTTQIQTTTKGLVVLLDDEEPIRTGFSQMFADKDIDLEFITVSKPSEYEQLIDNTEQRNRLRALIMDLSNSSQEVTTHKYKAAEYIDREFKDNRIPIFVHSANLEHYDELADQGTVFKIPKSTKSIEEICDTIKLMKESAFIDIFCIGGVLDNKIMTEVHSAFVNQFKKNEIAEIINSIQHTEKEESKRKKRTTEVFERIAIRSVYENWLSAKNVPDGSFEEVKLNAIEHYYRRTSAFDFWTGDIFRNTDDGIFSVVLTPRCNIGHKNFDEMLLCKLKKMDDSAFEEMESTKIADNKTQETKGQQSLRTSITDDVTNKRIGERFRFLPPTPQFEGGYVDYTTMYTLPPDEFLKWNERIISLSDELTNDVVRKFSAYVLRGGITETDFSEAHHYVTARASQRPKKTAVVAEADTVIKKK